MANRSYPALDKPVRHRLMGQLEEAKMCGLQSYQMPQALSAGVFALEIPLIGVGLYQRR
jgi:hypothetical protein